MTGRTIWAALLLTGGAYALTPGWSGSLPAAVFVGTALGTLLLVNLLAALRLPAPLAALGVVLLGLGGAYLVGVPAGADPVAALRDAVARLLTSERPAPPTLALLLPAALLILIVAAWVGLRTASAAGPGVGLVAAPVGAVALYGTGALLTAGSGDRYGILAAAIALVAAAGWFTVDSPRPGPVAALTRLFPPAALATGVVTLAAVTFGALWAGTGFEPRHLVDPPRHTVAESSPLPRIAAWQQAGDQELLRVTADDGLRLRLVVLTDFTGATWSASATYRRPGTAPEHPLPAARETSVSARVSITRLDGPWLPTPGRAVAISDAGVDVEPDTGSIAVREGSITPGMTYSVQALLDTPRAEEVAAASVGLDPGLDRMVELPQVPWAFTDYARRITYGASSPFEQAVAIEYAVREGRRADARAPVGSSYARLESFLFQPPGRGPGAAAGTSEQFAAAFAVLARAVGLPTRVVVGFNPGTAGPDGQRIVRGRDAMAWPEVYFQGLGWYAFDPAPGGGARTGSDEQLKLTVLDRMGAQVAQAAVVPSFSPPALPPPVQAAPAAEPDGPGTRLAVGAATAVALLLALIVAARALRRTRHRRAGDRGAWAEVLDLLVLMGRPAPRWRPAPDIAAELGRLAPAAAEPARRIAEAADRSAFAPAGGSGSAVRSTVEGPGSTVGGSASTVDSSAWGRVGSVRRAVRGVVPWPRRLLWTVDPRPLRRRR